MRPAILICVMLLGAPTACRVRLAAQRYDGSWWQSLSAVEQDAFVSAYLDCYIWDARGVDYSDQSIKQQVGSVSDFYKTHPNLMDMAVPDVVRTLGRSPTHAQGGERHGAYDGDFWRQLPDSGRLAFIQGYLECERLHLLNHFSRTPEAYVRTISGWYGVSDANESQLNDERANDKIGDVLTALRDKATRPE